jgi:hypothetical protein
LKDHAVLAQPKPVKVRATVNALQFAYVPSASGCEPLESGTDSPTYPAFQSLEVTPCSCGEKDLPSHGISASLLQDFSCFRIEYCSSIKPAYSLARRSRLITES